MRSCAIDDGQIKCWGQSPETLSGYSNPRNLRGYQVVAAVFCFVHDLGGTCLDKNGEIFNTPPLPAPLESLVPMRFNSDVDGYCGQTKENLYCWYDSYSEMFTVPVKNVRKIDPHGYVIDENGVMKISAGEKGTDWHYLENSRSITDLAGNYMIDSEGAHRCNDVDFQNCNLLPGFVHATQVASYSSSADAYSCILDDQGVTCMGGYGKHGKDIPRLKNPRHLMVSFEDACAIDDEGIKCWGENTFHQNEVIIDDISGLK